MLFQKCLMSPLWNDKCDTMLFLRLFQLVLIPGSIQQYFVTPTNEQQIFIKSYTVIKHLFEYTIFKLSYLTLGLSTPMPNEMVAVMTGLTNAIAQHVTEPYKTSYYFIKFRSYIRPFMKSSCTCSRSLGLRPVRKYLVNFKGSPSLYLIIYRTGVICLCSETLLVENSCNFYSHVSCSTVYYSTIPDALKLPKRQAKSLSS